MTHPTIDETIALAVRLHAGQRDKAGLPYIAHPLAVMRMVSEEVWHIAVLHDVLEDCDVTGAKLSDLGYTAEEVQALETLTHRSGSYEGYIKRIATSGNEMAIVVKYADLTDNVSRLPPGDLRKRYRKARLTLLHYAEEVVKRIGVPPCCKEREDEIDRLRTELRDLANHAVDGHQIGGTFHPYQPSEPLPLNDAPLTREELVEIRRIMGKPGATIALGTDVRRLLATIAQRDHLLYLITTDADPAGTVQQLVEAQDQVRQLSAKVEELERERR